MTPSNADLETQIRQALSRGHLFLEYQPIVSMQTRHVASAEALLRWNHPGGVRYPGSFLPAIAESDVMRSIALWVLHAACAQLAQWRTAGRDVSMCVNITPRRLLENTFIQEVHRTLERYQVPRNCLTLEITEHSELSREAAASPRVRELQAMGVRVAVDDLGAGFNTALALQSLAADTVKIDAALVAQAHQNEWHAKVLGGIVTICRQLGLRQIVEGIELDEQHRVVQQFDTELAQGYLYGRPVSSEEFGRLHLGVHSDSNSASASD